MATLQNILQLAKLGDPKAIAVLMNRHLQPKGITAKAGLRDGCLQVLLEAASIPDQSIVVFVRKGLTALGTEAIKRVRVYGKQTGEEVAAWIQEFELVTQIPISPITSSTTRKYTENIERVPTKKTQINPISRQPNKSTFKSIQEKNLAFKSSYGKNRKLLGASILVIALLIIAFLVFQVTQFRKDYKIENYKEADCAKTYKLMFNMIKQTKSDVNKFPLNKNSIEGQAKRIDKLVASLKSESIQLRDEKLKEITNHLITEAKTESASLRKIARMEAESKKLAPSAEKKLIEQLEFENKKAMQSLLDQFSLIKDGINYCKQ